MIAIALRLTIVSVLLTAAVPRHAPGTDATGTGTETIYLVSEHNGQPLADLRPDELDVRVAGQRVEVLDVAAGPQPLRLILLVDVTTRPSIHERDMRDSIDQFVASLQPADRARIGRVGRETTMGAAFTNDARTLLESARGAISPRPADKSGPSPIWDAIIRASETLQTEEGRRAVLLITDGRATGNRYGLGEAADRAVAANVSVNIVAPQAASIVWSESTIVSVHPERMPQALAQFTGGVYLNYSPAAFLVMGGQTTERVADFQMPAIVSSLRSEYAITIRRPEGKERRLIEVRVARGGLTLRARRALIGGLTPFDD